MHLNGKVRALKGGNASYSTGKPLARGTNALLSSSRGGGIKVATRSHKPQVVAMSSASVAAKGTKTGFYTGEDGFLYCDDVKIEDIRQKVRSSRLLMTMNQAVIFKEYNHLVG